MLPAKRQAYNQVLISSERMRKVLSIIFLSAVALCHGQPTDSISSKPSSGYSDAQKDSYPIINRLSLQTGLDYLATSIGDDLRSPVEPEDKIKVHSSMPVHLKYSFSFTDPSVRNYLEGGYQGIGVGILNIGILDKGGVSKSRHYIGYPVLAYVFQGGPFWHFNRRLSLDYEWNFGAAFGWKPYSESNEMFNLTVGSRVNAYLNLGICFRWRITEHSGLFAGVVVSHFSNGNTSWPNPGVNSFGLRIGYDWIINGVSESHYNLTYNKNIAGKQNSIDSEGDNQLTRKKRKRPEYNLTVWGASRKRVYRGGEEPVLLPGHFGCAGLSFAPLWSLGKWWRLGGSLDIQWDGSSDKKHDFISGDNTEEIKFRRGNIARQTSWGLSAHGELRMPIFAVNVGLGCNLYAPKENRGLYQNITLKTYLGPRVYLNVGYQLRNFYQQSNLMLGIGVSI